MIPRKSDRYDGCYNCAKRQNVECFKNPEKPVRIQGDGPCEAHKLMDAFHYSKSAAEAYREFQGVEKIEPVGSATER